MENFKGSETGQMIEHLSEIEKVAEDILADRQQMVDLDKKRQQAREAIRSISKDKKSKKQWVCFGNMFLKLPSDKAKRAMDKDFDQLDEEISNLRQNLKPKVSKLRDLELKDDIKGYSLNPLSKEELKMIETL